MLPVPDVKGYRSVLKHVFSLAGTDLAANHIISRMFSIFEKTCILRVYGIEMEPVSGSQGCYLSTLQAI